MSIEILQGSIEDAEDIMNFIAKTWKKDHVLAVNKEFFLYEFQKDQNLNIAIAKDATGIVGIFGYFYYNSSVNPDMAGAIWNIDPKVKDMLLGQKIRNFALDIVKPNFFATPGPGPQMKNVYRIMRMDWHEMNHYYLVNHNVQEFKVAKNPHKSYFKKVYSKDLIIGKAETIKDVENYKFSSDIVPIKDIHYIEKRFFNHPIYKYDIFYVKENNTIVNLIICRLCSANDSSAYRIVDFHGVIDYMKEITTYLYNFIVENDIEYIDFINYGYDDNLLRDAGFTKLNLNCDSVIIPNYFEPFIQKNIQIYCVSDKTNKKYRQHKADGDMDRPNIIKK